MSKALHLHFCGSEFGVRYSAVHSTSSSGFSPSRSAAQAAGRGNYKTAKSSWRARSITTVNLINCLISKAYFNTDGIMPGVCQYQRKVHQRSLEFMQWIAPTEKDTSATTLENRFWEVADKSILIEV
jgi:hypothetical protein